MQRRAESFFLLLLSIFFLISTAAIAMAAAEGSSEAAVHIIYTEKPPSDDVESHHLSTLAAVLGSEEAAKQSLVYVYKNAATGFSARLTPEQVKELSKQPGVLQVVPSQKMQLHSGGVGLTKFEKLGSEEKHPLITPSSKQVFLFLSP